jgi:hypothetical protein
MVSQAPLLLSKLLKYKWSKVYFLLIKSLIRFKGKIVRLHKDRIRQKNFLLNSPKNNKLSNSLTSPSATLEFQGLMSSIWLRKRGIFSKQKLKYWNLFTLSKIKENLIWLCKKFKSKLKNSKYKRLSIV